MRGQRRNEGHGRAEPTSREEAIRNGVLEQRIGVDPWERVQEPMALGGYVQFVFTVDDERENE
jgi:hypothetical protein